MLISCTLRHRYAIHTFVFVERLLSAAIPQNVYRLRSFRKKYIAGICADSDDGDLPVAHRSPISCELCL